MLILCGISIEYENHIRNDICHERVYISKWKKEASPPYMRESYNKIRIFYRNVSDEFNVISSLKSQKNVFFFSC